MLFVFGECTLDVDRRKLRRAGLVRPLEPKAFLVLVHLLTQRHRAVSKTNSWRPAGPTSSSPKRR
jgi:DNA-binding winged helix-turn-helix (wHTH) protein